MRHFTQLEAVAVTDEIRGILIPVLYGLDSGGNIWRKIAGRRWENISTQEYFEKGEGEME
jgi:hypothetical protein